MIFGFKLYGKQFFRPKLNSLFKVGKNEFRQQSLGLGYFSIPLSNCPENFEKIWGSQL